MQLPIPPRWVRRLVMAPLAVLVSFWVLTTLPLLVILAAVVSPFLPGSWRALRLLGFALFYLALELLGLVAAFGLWVGSGFGYARHRPWYVTAHYSVLEWLLRSLVVAAQRLFTLTVVQEPGREIEPIAAQPAPLVAMSRHAGVGDSFLLAHEILTVAHRRPRIVLKDTLQLDPMIDVYLNRLPNRFISTRPGRVGDPVAAIADLAAGMGPDDALLIFPEGGNFTPGRRSRAIARLWARGETFAAERAEELTYVLPPKPAGTFAALDACPQAVVVFVAHTGLDELDTARDIWRAIPQDNELVVSWLGVPRSEIPTDEVARGRWLLDRWEDIDTWVENRRTDQALADAPADPPGDGG